MYPQWVIAMGSQNSFSNLFPEDYMLKIPLGLSLLPGKVVPVQTPRAAKIPAVMEVPDRGKPVMNRGRSSRGTRLLEPMVSSAVMVGDDRLALHSIPVLAPTH